MKAVADLLSFKHRMETGPSPTDIDRRLNSAREKEACSNRKALVSIIDTILMCGRQNLVLRVSRGETGLVAADGAEPEENDGNFRSLLRLRIRVGDKDLLDHCLTAKKNATYMSSTIQNEIIVLISDMIKQAVVERASKAVAYTVIADETLDWAKLKQMAICLRFLI